MKLTKTIKRWSIILLSIAIIGSLALYTPNPQGDIQYYERESGLLKTEKVAGEKWLLWLYYNPIGELSLWALAKRKLASSIYGKMMDHSASTKMIQPFIEEFDIDTSIAQAKKFENFNDFFTRKLKASARPIDTSLNTLVSPTDGKILAYQDVTNSDFIVKGFRFDVSSFLNNPELAQKYDDGTALVIRLAPIDYHRFHAPINGILSPNVIIEGDYYSVNPLALRKKAKTFYLNKREYTILTNPLFGDVIMVEVGATMVGSIIQTHTSNYIKKGEEKGYFKFGGSTIVLLFENNTIKVDKDLLINTAEGYETMVEMGERIGEKM